MSNLIKTPAPGQSKYPIVAGAVFKLEKPILKYNERLGTTAIPHNVYIWIQSVHKKRGKKQAKFRGVSICKISVPVPKDLKREFTPVKANTVQFEYITRLLKNGFEIVGKAKFDHNKILSYKRFYRLIGIM